MHCEEWTEALGQEQIAPVNNRLVVSCLHAAAISCPEILLALARYKLKASAGLANG